MEPDISELSNKVFNNPVIVQKIVGKVTSIIPCTNLYCIRINLRLINKTFNSEVLSKWREEHKNALIVKLDAECKEDSQCEVKINKYQVTFDRMNSCFWFLRNVVRVEVHSLEYREHENPWSPKRASFLHHEITNTLLGPNNRRLTKLFGMEHLCNGCDRCINLGSQCSEQSCMFLRNVQEGFSEAKHFKKIGVYYGLLNQLAHLCSQGSKDKSECLSKLSTRVTDTVTCDTLCLILPDKIELSLPLEVIYLMLKQWKVKNITIKYDYPTRDSAYNKVGNYPNFFTTFNLESETPSQLFAGLSLDTVELDIDTSCHGACKLGIYGNFHKQIRSLRNAFPTNKIAVIFGTRGLYNRMNEMTSIIFNLNNEMKQKNLEQKLFFKWEPDSTSQEVNAYTLDGSFSLNMQPSEHVQSWKIMKITQLDDFSNKSYGSSYDTGKLFELFNETINSTIYLEIVASSKKMRTFVKNPFHRAVIHSGFLIHFYNDFMKK